MSTILKLENRKAIDLLEKDHQMHYGWQTDFNRRKLFFVRGMTEFFALSQLNATEIQKAIPAMRDTLRANPEFDNAVTTWLGENFANNQINDAKNTEALTFDKAVQVILTCAVKAEELKMANNPTLSVEWVFENMYISPCVYFISNFNEGTYKEITANNKDFFENLCSQTNHNSAKVFLEMTKGNRVTLNFANDVLKQLKSKYPEMIFGDIRSYDKNQKELKPCENHLPKYDDHKGRIITN